MMEITNNQLSAEQQIAFDKYIQGHNIFITGPGGSGKSALIRKINDHAQSRNKKIQVCALTGCAAVLLNCKAKTLHSWSGIGLGTGTIENNIRKIINSNFKKNIWKETSILVVDEVSMLSLKLFNMLNEIGKVVRKSQRPFGGIQLIFSGDFYQLPPVGNKDEPDTSQFCFESDDWNSVFHRDCQIPLIKIFRQTDETYSNILNQIREGQIKRRTNDTLLQYVGREKPATLLVKPTKLYPTRNQVENINNNEMRLLDQDAKQFNIKYVYDEIEMSKEDKLIRQQFSADQIKKELDYLTTNLICDKELQLKIGCQVMCVVNIKSTITNEELLCNGSQGIIIKFCETTSLPVVKFNNGHIRTMTPHIWESENIPGIGVSQVPLILAWALTIHKSQGATMDVAEIDVGNNIFECGQTYVALSRVKSLDGLFLTSFDARKIKINKKVKVFYEELNVYRESMTHNREIYEPILIAEPLQIQTQSHNQNPFVNFQYTTTPITPIRHITPEK
jgi:ATP-dependent DNA helicase PIF1